MSVIVTRMLGGAKAGTLKVIQDASDYNARAHVIVPEAKSATRVIGYLSATLFVTLLPPHSFPYTVIPAQHISIGLYTFYQSSYATESANVIMSLDVAQEPIQVRQVLGVQREVIHVH
jgi:hypothetical protein